MTRLVFDYVDMDLLEEQYVRLQEVVAFVEAARVGMGGDVPDASILDGIVEMLGNVLPIRSDEEE